MKGGNHVVHHEGLELLDAMARGGERVPTDSVIVPLWIRNEDWPNVEKLVVQWRCEQAGFKFKECPK